MSLKTWRDEFYPCDADSPEAKADPIRHALRKWIGLRADELKGHAVRTGSTGRRLKDHHNEEFVVDTDTCALCSVHFQEWGWCPTCPLSLARGGFSCDVERVDEISPYREWTEGFNPEPMIELLKAALQNKVDKVEEDKQ